MQLRVSLWHSLLGMVGWLRHGLFPFGRKHHSSMKTNHTQQLQHLLSPPPPIPPSLSSSPGVFFVTTVTFLPLLDRSGPPFSFFLSFFFLLYYTLCFLSGKRSGAWCQACALITSSARTNSKHGGTRHITRNFAPTQHPHITVKPESVEKNRERRTRRGRSLVRPSLVISQITQNNTLLALLTYTLTSAQHWEGTNMPLPTKTGALAAPR